MELLRSLLRGGDRGEWVVDVLQGPFETVLDIGCSRGWTLAPLQQKARRLVGIDMDQCALAEARAAYPGIEFIQQTAVTLPFPSESFDAVILSEVIEHVGNENKRTVIDEAHRVLKSGGVFVFTAPYAGMLARLDPMDFKRRFPKIYRAYMRLTHYTPDTSIEIGHEHVSDKEIETLFARRFDVFTIEYCGLFMPFFTWLLAIDNRLKLLPGRWHQWLNRLRGWESGVRYPRALAFNVRLAARKLPPLASSNR
jgi:SAM-dependent methyltransferase